MQRGVIYGLQRASEVLGEEGRWDFVATAHVTNRWIAIEIKGLVWSPIRQFRGWSSFLSRYVTKRLRSKVKSSYCVLVAIPWKFRQQEANSLIEPLIEALAEIDPGLAVGERANLGPSIAAKFPPWPTKPPTRDQKLWLEQRVWKVIQPPEDLFVSKYSTAGSSIELGASVGEFVNIDGTLLNALPEILVKANVQLRSARGKGASETVLLLESHIEWKPELVAQALRHEVDKALLSDIDAVYLVHDGRAKVAAVWP